ncbi:MAG: fumarylacetoacetate hydrolase family protein [Actinomycetota bacterium]|nr:fumarylacetoacetate hydrolase family protein [Actinomycetota bacterium]
MQLVMFHPFDHPLKRGWVGRLDGDQVIQLAAQTLQAFFTGGGSAREHAVFPLSEVRLLAPVLYPPAVRVFDDARSFSFANPAAILGPGAQIAVHGTPCNSLLQGDLVLLPRLAAMVGDAGAIGGFTAVADWRRPALAPPKDRDFALALGPAVVTLDELDPDGLEAVVRVDGEERLRGRFKSFDWKGARASAVEGTTLRPGDLVVGPALDTVADFTPGSAVEFEVAGIGVLRQTIVR